MKYGNRNIKNKEEELNNRYDEENIRFRLDEFVAIYYTIYVMFNMFILMLMYS